MRKIIDIQQSEIIKEDGITSLIINNYVYRPKYIPDWNLFENKKHDFDYDPQKEKINYIIAKSCDVFTLKTIYYNIILKYNNKKFKTPCLECEKYKAGQIVYDKELVYRLDYIYICIFCFLINSEPDFIYAPEIDVIIPVNLITSKKQLSYKNIINKYSDFNNIKPEILKKCKEYFLNNINYSLLKCLNLNILEKAIEIKNL